MSPEEISNRFPAGRYRPVLITEVTRMREGYYCVAGWDVYEQRMVRPLQPTGDNWQLRSGLLPFQVGELVNCVAARRQHGLPPHSHEDLVLARQAETLAILSAPQTFALLRGTVDKSIGQLFDNKLIEYRYVHELTSCRSLGALAVARKRTSFFLDEHERLRLHVTDVDGMWYELKVTSEQLLRVFCAEGERAGPDNGATAANAWLRAIPKDDEILLRVGLARGWNGGAEINWSPKRCYVQLNGIICPKDNQGMFDK